MRSTLIAAAMFFAGCVAASASQSVFSDNPIPNTIVRLIKVPLYVDPVSGYMLDNRKCMSRSRAFEVGPGVDDTPVGRRFLEATRSGGRLGPRTKYIYITGRGRFIELPSQAIAIELVSVDRFYEEEVVVPDRLESLNDKSGC
jgi:hypothetical protein